jgi:hypothetical protein
VVKKTIRDIGGAQFPILTRTNYAEWEVVVKVMLKARSIWKVVSFGTDNEEEDHLAMEAILKTVPAEYRVTLGSKDSALEACDVKVTKPNSGKLEDRSIPWCSWVTKPEARHTGSSIQTRDGW